MYRYIGQKYKNVRYISIQRSEGNSYSSLSDEYLPNVYTSFEEPLVHAVANMKQLSTFKFMIYPLTTALSRAFDTTKLTNLQLFVDTSTYQEQLQALKSSRIVKSINYLELR